ncbi:MAG: hypothetical protein CMM95_02790 [Rickettsiales bacterium]|nr:hypothetical protein [Rickettsiales bacterium]
MENIEFDNTFSQLSREFYEEINPEPVKEPKLIKLNNELSKYLSLDYDFLKSRDGLLVLSGNKTPDGSKPIALAYAGHQFGNFVPQLGDGRAILLGEVIAIDGKRYDVQLKGSGKTSFSRQGDGRAPLGPVIREYVISEAMHFLGIPTTRSLSIVSSGEYVQRESSQPGGVLTRIASSHIRIGTFEYFFARKDFKSLKRLADYTAKRHFPDSINDKKNTYKSILEETIKSQASLVASWMSVGFIHGVMNTDNTTISGETIDYGPCAFMDHFHPQKVFSYIDASGRYSYSNQGQIMLWNLSILAQCLSPLISDDEKKSHNVIIDLLNTFPELFKKNWISKFKMKLGMSKDFPEDKKLIESFLEILLKQNIDFTQAFRALCEEKNSAHKNDFLFSSSNNKKLVLDWANNWKQRIVKEKKNIKKIKNEMKKVNPIYIPRNHIMEEIIKEAVENNRYDLMNDLLNTIKDPFTEKTNKKHLSLPPKPNQVVKNTFCGT